MSAAEARSLLLLNAAVLAGVGLLITCVIGLGRERPWAHRYSLALFGGGALLLARLGFDRTASSELIAIAAFGGIVCLFQCVFLLTAALPSDQDE